MPDTCLASSPSFLMQNSTISRRESCVLRLYRRYVGLELRIYHYIKIQLRLPQALRVSASRNWLCVLPGCVMYRPSQSFICTLLRRRRQYIRRDRTHPGRLGEILLRKSCSSPHVFEFCISLRIPFSALLRAMGAFASHPYNSGMILEGL